MVTVCTCVCVVLFVCESGTYRYTDELCVIDDDDNDIVTYFVVQHTPQTMLKLVLSTKH